MAVKRLGGVGVDERTEGDAFTCGRAGRLGGQDFAEDGVAFKQAHEAEGRAPARRRTHWRRRSAASGGSTHRAARRTALSVAGTRYPSCRHNASAFRAAAASPFSTRPI